jgi:hypothetical protein
VAVQSANAMRRKLAEAEADLAFEWYFGLGAERALASLPDAVRAMGVKAKSLKTYERWSKTYEWQERLVVRESTRVRELVSQKQVVAAERQTVHQTFAAALMGIAAMNLNAYRDSVDGTPIRLLKPHELADFGRTAVAMDREALGLDSDRTSIRLEAMSQVWQVLQSLFSDVMALPTDEERQESWLERGKQRVAQLLLGDVGDQIPMWLQIDPVSDLTEAEEVALTMVIAAKRDGIEMPNFRDYPPLPPPGGYAVDAAGVELE